MQIKNNKILMIILQWWEKVINLNSRVALCSYNFI